MKTLNNADKMLLQKNVFFILILTCFFAFTMERKPKKELTTIASKKQSNLETSIKLFFIGSPNYNTALLINNNQLIPFYENGVEEENETLTFDKSYEIQELFFYKYYYIILYYKNNNKKQLYICLEKNWSDIKKQIEKPLNWFSKNNNFLISHNTDIEKIVIKNNIIFTQSKFPTIKYTVLENDEKIRPSTKELQKFATIFDSPLNDNTIITLLNPYTMPWYKKIFNDTEKFRTYSISNLPNHTTERDNKTHIDHNFVYIAIHDKDKDVINLSSLKVQAKFIFPNKDFLIILQKESDNLFKISFDETLKMTESNLAKNVLDFAYDTSTNTIFYCLKKERDEYNYNIKKISLSNESNPQNPAKEEPTILGDFTLIEK
jgi:hypothetical protein